MTESHNRNEKNFREEPRWKNISGDFINFISSASRRFCNFFFKQMKEWMVDGWIEDGQMNG